MYEYLPQSTVLGKLEFVEVYEYYDRPCLFCCKNSSSQLFLAVWVDSLDTKDVWLYAPISSKRLESLKNKEIDLRSVFTESEAAKAEIRKSLYPAIDLKNIFTKSKERFVFKVVTPFEDLSRSTVEVLVCSDISEDNLPKENQYLNRDDRKIEVVI